MSVDKKASYYDAGGLETMDIIMTKLTYEQFIGFCLGNAIKYLSRYNFKHRNKFDALRDIEKAEVYLQTLHRYVMNAVKQSTKENDK